MKTKIVGLFLTTLLALSLVGVGYAYWTDTLVIEGSVTTGTFWGYLTLDTYYDVEGKNVGSVYAELGGAEEEADGELYNKLLTVSIKDAYPGYQAHIHWDMHWMGSVPAHVYVTGWEDLPNWLQISVYVMSTSPAEDTEWAAYWDPNPGQSMPFAEFLRLMEASQWHYCHDVHFCFQFDVIENDELKIDPPQNAEITFGMQFNFYQYNTSPPTP